MEKETFAQKLEKTAEFGKRLNVLSNVEAMVGTTLDCFKSGYYSMSLTLNMLTSLRIMVEHQINVDLPFISLTAKTAVNEYKSEVLKSIHNAYADISNTKDTAFLAHVETMECAKLTGITVVIRVDEEGYYYADIMRDHTEWCGSPQASKNMSLLKEQAVRLAHFIVNGKNWSEPV